MLEHAVSGGQPVREPLHLVAANAAEPAASEKVGRMHAPVAEQVCTRVESRESFTTTAWPVAESKYSSKQ